MKHIDAYGYKIQRCASNLLSKIAVYIHNIILFYVHQGRRKQFFSGQANQLQSCVYTEFRVMGGHKCKLLCEAHCMSMHNMLILGSGGMPAGKF